MHLELKHICFSSRRIRIMHEKIKIILEQHVGKQNSITSAEIASILGIKEDATHPKTRRFLFETAELYELPIAATTKNPKGYFLITNDEEYDEYIATLDSRIDGIEERKKIITNNYKRRK